MAAHPPPVPPEQKNPVERDLKSGVGADAGRDEVRDNKRQRNLDEQGRQGNLKQNTTNKGYQQDR
jgi:hypothetical protein